jgi:hypothetical protein
MDKERATVAVKCIPARCEGEYVVTIFDALNNTVSQSGTDKYGKASVNISNPSGEYRIRVRSVNLKSPRAINTWLSLRPDRGYLLYFLFGRFFIIPPCRVEATFRLTDRNYDGLPIEKGVIVLA